jgi:putative multiple sugar transport system substrate-binding protein
VRKTLTGLAGLTGVALVLSLAACSSGTQTDGVHANMGATVGIAMPSKTSKRWLDDGNNMVAQFRAMGYKTDLQNGDDKIPLQVAQVQAMIDHGDKLLVIGSIDGTALKKQLAEARAKGIKVIAYDRLIRDSPNVDDYVTFDNFRVGVLQGTLIANKLGLAKGNGPYNLEMFGGSPDDNNAGFFFNGAMSVLKPYITAHQLVVPSGKTEFKEIATLRWDVPTAQARMKKVLAADYQNKHLDAVLSPFDGMSVGLIKTLTDAGYHTAAKPLPVITGQDAELNSVKLIIAGEQTGTIYKDTRELAKVAVQQGNALLTGSAPIINDTTTYDNGVRVIPTYLLQPIAIDKTNYQTLLIDGGYYTAASLVS